MMFFLKKKKGMAVTSAVCGKLKDLSEVNDPVFSSGTMGQGFATEPVDGAVCAPVSGTVSTVFPGGHAIGITTSSKAEVLIHIGIDTVKRNGAGFKSYVGGGEQISQGDRLVDVDFTALKKAGFECDVIVVVIGGEKCAVDKELIGKKVTTHDTVMTLFPK